MGEDGVDMGGVRGCLKWVGRSGEAPRSEKRSLRASSEIALKPQAKDQSRPALDGWFQDGWLDVGLHLMFSPRIP